MNIVTLIGRITKNPEVRYTTGSEPKAVCSFTLAVNRFDRDRTADFIRCVTFGKNAENMEKYVDKGNQLGVTGRIHADSYEKNGQRVYTTDVICDKVEFLGSKDEPKKQAEKQIELPGGIPDGFEVIDEGDVPF